MAGLLHVQSSPGGDRSDSIRVSRAFMESWRESNPHLPAATLNLWTANLPDLGGASMTARLEVEAGRRPMGEAEAAWGRLEELVRQLLDADRLLISAPMWNFGIPYRLKQYIDCVTQPTLSYRGSPVEGFTGLVREKPAVLILARGGSYPAGSDREPFDFQRKYLEAWSRFLGFGPVDTILVEPTSTDPESVARCEIQARSLAGGS